MRLTVTPWRLAVCRLTAPGLPDWARASRFLTLSVTPTETSLVCEAACVPDGVRSERGWRCLGVDGTLDFALVGIVAGLTTVLADHGISVFVVSTFDTDYVLVKADRLDAATAALAAAGYAVARA